MVFTEKYGSIDDFIGYYTGDSYEDIKKQLDLEAEDILDKYEKYDLDLRLIEITKNNEKHTISIE
jgi:hypothetical protein